MALYSDVVTVRRSGMLAAVVALLVVVGTNGCAKKPTMKVNHAEMQGVQLGFPPSLAVQMTVVIDVYNPNGYDVAVRAMRGNVSFFDRYTLPIDFRPGGDGVWLPSKATTQVRVPTAVPVDLAVRITREAMTGNVPYHVVGKADVTATRSMQIEKDDYSVDERGEISSQVIAASIASIGIPFAPR